MALLKKKQSDGVPTKPAKGMTGADRLKLHMAKQAKIKKGAK